MPDSAAAIKRLAIFVEGHTELLFVERLITEVARNKGLHFETHSASPGDEPTFSYCAVECRAAKSGADRIIVVFNCCGDSKIKSAIAERYSGFSENGYRRIVALRDVYPEKKADIQKMFYTRMRSKPVPVELVLAEMEIEAWFIADTTHFLKISPKLTREHIAKFTPYNLSTTEPSTFEHPAEVLNSIYKTVGLSYAKTEKHRRRTIEALDFADLCFTTREGMRDFKTLLGFIEDFF